MWDMMVSTSVAGNEVWRWILFCVALLFSLIAGRLSCYFLLQASKKNDSSQNKWRGVVFKSLSRPALVLSVTLVLFVVDHLRLIVLPKIIAGVFDTGISVMIYISVGYVIYCLVDVIDFKLGGFAEKTDNKVDDMLVPMVGKSIRVTVILLIILQVAQELSNKPMASILAGLGVGGLAIALAGQDTIKNFFGTLVIVGDKPFEIGDRIVIDGHDGPVVSVGFRSTKLRTLSGHLVTVPNSSIVNKTIQNIGKREFIKHVANVAITYDTPPDKVDQALDIIKDLLHDHEGMKADMPPRVYFNALNDWALNIIVIFWYHPPEYWDYMNFVENFNRQLLRSFNDCGITFAFPTQTVYVPPND